jgi:hypothetical protein
MKYTSIVTNKLAKQIVTVQSVTKLTSGCIRFFPIGYLYGFDVCIEKAVNHKINPDNRSRRESRVEAIIAREPLLTETYTFAAKRAMFAMLDSRMANVSLLATLSRSSCR